MQSSSDSRSDRRAARSRARGFTLIEVLAARRKLVLVVGPELDDLEACGRDTLARALARVAANAQVLQFDCAAAPWRERGATVSSL